MTAERQAFVWIDSAGTDGPRLAGRLWARSRAGRESASFEYDRSWLDAADRFSLEPALQLDPGPFHTAADQRLFASLGDSAPDRWGRMLMRRAERRRAAEAGETPRHLTELDFLLGVVDEARQGALRFSLDMDGPFLAAGGEGAIPPLVRLEELLGAADRVEVDREASDDLRLLLAPGSSLGGARPKASVRDRDGALSIAKFPSGKDEIDAVRWEAAALTLAERAGIAVPAWRLQLVGGRPVLLLRRFDRTAAGRTPYLSAMSMLGAADRELRSYLEIVDALRRHGAAAKPDVHQLWRRAVFNVAISNTDDHLRNHGFLHEGKNGWRLAPAFDLNPVPADVGPRVLSTAIDVDDATASLDVALRVAPYFELGSDEARRIVREVESAVARWRPVARSLGIERAEIDRVESAFRGSRE